MIRPLPPRRWFLVLASCLPWVAAAVSPSHAQVIQTLRRGAGRVAEAFAPKSLDEAPAWAKRAEPPLFTFVWASDFHLDRSRRELIAEALHHIDRQLKPDFIMITGDNNACVDETEDPSAPRSLRRQRFLKTFLAEHLKTPYAIIPGDNWPRDFEKVFGPMQYSFDYGGMHFIFLAVDRAVDQGKSEGLAVFDPETWAWLRSDLEENREKPTIVALHEPIFPPTFLDARPLKKLLDAYPNVIACFHGHLHADMELHSKGRTYLLCPALGPVPTPAMKYVAVHPRLLVVRTVEYDKTRRCFKTVNKWQKIDVPPSLQKCLARPDPPRFAMNHYQAVPPHPHRNAPELILRFGELVVQVQKFIGEEMPRLNEELGGK